VHPIITRALKSLPVYVWIATAIWFWSEYGFWAIGLGFLIALVCAFVVGVVRGLAT
jgi:hypothetical protein